MSDEVNITPEALLSHKEAQRLQAVKFYKKQDKEIRASGGYKEIY